MSGSEGWDPWVRLADVPSETINSEVKLNSYGALSGAATALINAKVICGNTLGYKLCATDDDWEDIPPTHVRKSKTRGAPSAKKQRR